MRRAPASRDVTERGRVALRLSSGQAAHHRGCHAISRSLFRDALRADVTLGASGWVKEMATVRAYFRPFLHRACCEWRRKKEALMYRRAILVTRYSGGSFLSSIEGGWESLRNLMQMLLSRLPRCVSQLTSDGCVTGRAASGQFRPRVAGMGPELRN
jgi:hypothetical protein